jgi:gluconate 2-dehydrogenase gamma chain
MDRRKTLKTLLAGTVGTALVAKTTGCETPTGDTVEAGPVPGATEAQPLGYGLRTAKEVEHDAKVKAARFFTDAELATIAILADIIAPGGDGEPSATEAGVPEWIEFMANDQPEYHQTKMRGGLMWLNIESSRRFEGKVFSELTETQRIEIVEDIAWPEEAKGTEMEAGANFFSHMRFMTVSGYFTSKEGIKTLDYQGNAPNVWDGVPQEVLDKHGLAYDEKYLPLYVDQSRREIMAEWDDDGNLIS